MIPYLNPSLAELLPQGEGRFFFSVWVCTAKNETKVEIEAAQSLFNGRRMEKWDLNRKSTSCPGDWQLRQDFKGKANEGEVYALVFWE